jgi:hypothetical protein
MIDSFHFSGAFVKRCHAYFISYLSVEGEEAQRYNFVPRTWPALLELALSSVRPLHPRLRLNTLRQGPFDGIEAPSHVHYSAITSTLSHSWCAIIIILCCVDSIAIIPPQNRHIHAGIGMIILFSDSHPISEN